MNIEELIKKATKFTIWSYGVGQNSFNIDIMLRSRKGYNETNEDKWAVLQGSFLCYNKEKKDFEAESLPSSREDEFLRQTRYSLEEAVCIAEKMACVFEKSKQETIDDPKRFIVSLQINMENSDLFKKD